MQARILIIDDQPANVVLLERILQQGGYEFIHTLTDPRDVVTSYLERQPDLILLDLTMPHMDGFEVMRRLNPLIPEGGFVPILVLTADDSQDARRRALAEGATDFLTKPFDAIEVLLRVKNLLRTRLLHLGTQRANRDLEERVRERTLELDEVLAREMQLNHRLRELDRLKDAFLTAVSHEVRTPLTVISATADTFERRAGELSPEQLQQFAGRLATATRRLKNLLGSVLDSDRLRRGLLEPALEPTDIADVARGLLERLDLKGRALELRLQEVRVEVDRAQFERIVESLVVNAVHHTPEGTPVVLDIGFQDGGVLIAVDDSGPGVPDDHKLSIFEPFAQGEIPFHSPGLGLGLALVGQFAKLHGGRAWVEDRAEGGAAFRVWLPTRPAMENHLAGRS